MASRFIYVVGVAVNPVKIGVASNIARRLSTLQIGCPDVLVLHHEIRVPEFLACDIETAVHRKLRPHHRHGEWFNVAADKARAVVDEISERLRVKALGKAERVGDLLDELEVQFEINRHARRAMQFYRSLASRPDGKILTQRLNALIAKEAGMIAYTVFQMLLVNQQPLPSELSLHPAGARGAHAELVKALNALAAYYDRNRIAQDRQLAQFA